MIKDLRTEKEALSHLLKRKEVEEVQNETLMHNLRIMSDNLKH